MLCSILNYSELKINQLKVKNEKNNNMESLCGLLILKFQDCAKQSNTSIGQASKIVFLFLKKIQTQKKERRKRKNVVLFIITDVTSTSQYVPMTQYK